METDVEIQNNKSEDSFVKLRKFSSNFHKLVHEKSLKTLTPTKNQYEVLTDESDKESKEDKIGKIVKKGANYRLFNPDDLPKNTPHRYQ